MNSIKLVRKAIIPVAGLGTRMLPATKAIPKELLPISDKPIIEYVVKEAIAAGINEIIFVTRSGKEAIENHFDTHYELEHRLVQKGSFKILEEVKEIIPNYVKINTVRQLDALGLGHAILCAKHLINGEPFAVLLPDVFVLEKKFRTKNFSLGQLVSFWNNTGIGQVMVEKVDFDKIKKYGIIDTGEKNITPFRSIPLRGLIEKPDPQNAPSNLAILGRYILPPQLLDLIENINPGVGNEIQLTDALSKLLEIEGLNAVITDADIYDCGDKLGYLSANLAVGFRDPKIKADIYGLFNKLIDDDFPC